VRTKFHLEIVAREISMPLPGIERNNTCIIFFFCISCLRMLLGHTITVASRYLAYREITVSGNSKHIVWFTMISVMVVAVIVSPITIKIIILVQQIRKQKRENEGSNGKY
jgi:hypothetical protein